MTANVDAMVRAGVDAFRAGNKTEARTLLEKVLELDEYNEQAWLWLSAVVETPEEQRTCLENVLVINPKNERARMGLKSLGVDPDALAAAGAAPGQSPFTENSFMADDEPPPAAPFAAETPAFSGSAWEDEDAPPTASSSASSSSFKGAQHTSADYDSWIDGMGLGGGKKDTVKGPFGGPEDDIEDSGLFGSDEDDFELVQPTAPKGSTSSSVLFDEAEEDDIRSSSLDVGEDDEDFLSTEVMAEFDAALEDGTDASLDDLFSGKGLEGMPDIKSTAEFNTSGGGELDPHALFAMIPAEIKAASRLPGEDESAPRLMMMGAVLLVLGNIGALVFLVSQVAPS